MRYFAIIKNNRGFMAIRKSGNLEELKQWARDYSKSHPDAITLEMESFDFSKTECEFPFLKRDIYKISSNSRLYYRETQKIF